MEARELILMKLTWGAKLSGERCGNGLGETADESRTVAENTAAVS
jgi:hypothetical protein